MKWRPFSDGYIGVSRRDLRKRWNEHAKAASKVGRMIRKLGLTFADMRILAKGIPGSEVRTRERALRPEAGIGWNKRCGGGISDDRTYFMYHISLRYKIMRLLIWAIPLLAVIFLFFL